MKNRTTKVTEKDLPRLSLTSSVWNTAPTASVFWKLTHIAYEKMVSQTTL